MKYLLPLLFASPFFCFAQSTVSMERDSIIPPNQWVPSPDTIPQFARMNSALTQTYIHTLDSVIKYNMCWRKDSTNQERMFTRGNMDSARIYFGKAFRDRKAQKYYSHVMDSIKFKIDSLNATKR